MEINLNNIVSITEANQNFSKVARIVDDNGTVVIMKNNKPRYVLLDYNQLKEAEIKEDKIPNDTKLEKVANNILAKHIKAFEELAKWLN